MAAKRKMTALEIENLKKKARATGRREGVQYAKNRVASIKVPKAPKRRKGAKRAGSKRKKKAMNVKKSSGFMNLG